jgi:hypothetical protein
MGTQKLSKAQRSNQGSANQGNFGKPVLRPERQSHLVDGLNKIKEFSNDAQVINSPLFCDIRTDFECFICALGKGEIGKQISLYKEILAKPSVFPFDF